MVKRVEDLRIKEFTCKNCGTHNKVTEKYLGQDIDGMYAICKECNSPRNIE